MLQQQLWRAGHVQKKLLTGSRRGVNGTRIPQCGLQGYTGVTICGRHPVSIDLSAEVGKKTLHFGLPKLGDRPPAGELIAPLYHSLLLL